MKIFSAIEAAAELGIDARALRRFLRNDPSYRNVGMGGRYVFTQAEMISLGRAYKAHARNHPAKGRVVEADPRILDDDPGVPVSALTEKGLTPALRAQRRAARELRQQRLLDRMEVVGIRRYDDELIEDEE